MRKPIAGWASGHPAVALLHEHTVTGRPAAEPDDRPRNAKVYARRPRVALAAPGAIAGTLESARASRRSAVAMHGSRQLPLSALGTLLHWSAGRRRKPDVPWSDSRFFPSAGALYPLEVYVVARGGAGLPRALYHWSDAPHELERLPVPVGAVDTVYAALRFPWHAEAPAVLVVTARPERTLASYGARGYRFVLLEAGALLQNFGLVAAALGLAGSAIGTNLDRVVEDALALDPDDELFLTAFALGVPGSRIRSREECREIVAAARRGHASSDQGVVPVSPVVATTALGGLPLWDGCARVPGLATLTAVEGLLGTRLMAELPAELHAVPPDLWDAFRGVRRLAQSGLPIVWGAMTPRPDEPPFHGYRVKLGTVDAGAGTDVSSPALALSRATSEAVERFVWCERAPASARLRVATAAALGSAAVGLGTLAGYAKDLRARHPERLAWSAETPFTWIAGQSLTRDAAIWVPLQAVSSAGPEPRDTPAREPELRPRVTTGVAAHPDRTTAILHGLREVIERDAAMLAWLTRRAGNALDVTGAADAGLQELARRFDDAGLTYALARLHTDAPLAVVVAALRDPSGVGPALALGTCAAPSVPAAAQKALLEALMVWRLVRGLRADGLVAPTCAKALDQRSRLLWWSEPGRWEEVRWLFAGPVATSAGTAIERDGAGELATLLAWCRAAGEEVIAVDLSDEATVHQLGHHVVATVAPSFHPMHLYEPWPALWSPRLARVSSGPLNLDPHPFP
jgi:thiazole/oxazole-forming peptide maturase SagD family component